MPVMAAHPTKIAKLVGCPDRWSGATGEASGWDIFASVGLSYGGHGLSHWTKHRRLCLCASSQQVQP